MKTSELTGPPLDWAVAEARSPGHGALILANEEDFVPYSTDWSQGGPIIEREKLTVEPSFFMGGGWRAYHQNLCYDDKGKYISGADNMQDGPTPLIAAMRCYVASKLGEEVEIPKELS